LILFQHINLRNFSQGQHLDRLTILLAKISEVHPIIRPEDDGASTIYPNEKT
jgi:hypothetical protein